MDVETFRHFKYEIALGAPIPMPKNKIEYFPHNQFTVQQYLHTLCKVNIGALGKKDGRWYFPGEEGQAARLHSRPDILEIFDAAEKMGILEPKPPEEEPQVSAEEGFAPYRLSKSYWEKFDKYAS